MRSFNVDDIDIAGDQNSGIGDFVLRPAQKCCDPARGELAVFGRWYDRGVETCAAKRGLSKLVIGAVKLSYDALDDDAKLVADLCAWWAPEGLDPGLISDAPGGGVLGIGF